MWVASVSFYIFGLKANSVFCFKAEVKLVEISNHLMAELDFAGFYWRQMMTTNGISTEAFHWLKNSLEGIRLQAWQFFTVCVPVVVIAAPVGSVVATHFHRFVKDLHWIVNHDYWLLTSIIYILPNCYNCLAPDFDSYTLPRLGKFWPAWSTFLTRWPLSLRLRFSTWRQSSGFSPSPSLQATLILVLVLNMVFEPTFHNMYVLCLVSCRWRHILHSSLVGWPEVFQQPWSFIAMGTSIFSWFCDVGWILIMEENINLCNISDCSFLRTRGKQRMKTNQKHE